LKKKIIIEKIIESSNANKNSLIQVNSEKIMEFICDELGTNLEKIPVDIKSEHSVQLHQFCHI